MTQDTIDQANRAPMLWDSVEEARQEILTWAGTALPLPLAITGVIAAITIIAVKSVPILQMCGL